jgi:hypothetical protein
MLVRERPLLTDVFETTSKFVPDRSCAYVLRAAVEPRSSHIATWQSNAADCLIVSIIDEQPSAVIVELEGVRHTVQLRSSQQLAQLWDRIVKRPAVYVDITGIRHHVWAPLIKSALGCGLRVMAVYVEPAKYRPSLTPTEGEIYDLSERISGISPIPGFTSFTESNDSVCFIPLLGFEGTRVAYLIEHVQPPSENIIPIVGVPGFSPEYPFAAYLGNRSALLETQSWKNIRYAIANCPFSLFYALEDIAAERSGQQLKIAPIGTKPHALGAVMYAIVNPAPVELIYDHPIRKNERTEGTARLLVYHVSSFMA